MSQCPLFFFFNDMLKYCNFLEMNVLTLLISPIVTNCFLLAHQKGLIMYISFIVFFTFRIMTAVA